VLLLSLVTSAAGLGHTQDPGGDPALFISYEGGGGRLWRDVACHGEQDAAALVLHAGICDAETAFKGGGGPEMPRREDAAGKGPMIAPESGAGWSAGSNFDSRACGSPLITNL